MEKTIEKGVSNIVGALCDPIIAYPSPWKGDIPPVGQGSDNTGTTRNEYESSQGRGTDRNGC